MYRLPEGYKGKIIAFFDFTEEYSSDTFFAVDGSGMRESSLGTYFEASDKALSRFGFRFRIENTEKPHMLVVRYPDDKRRHMMINDCLSYDLSCGVFTGEEREVSGSAKTIYRVFHTRTNDMTITFTSWGDGEPAAIFGFAVYELEDLEKFSTNRDDGIEKRSFGIKYEDPCGVLSDLGATSLADWCDRITEFAHHTGQNTIVQPIHWYHGPLFDSKTNPAGVLYWATLPDHTQYSITSTKPDDWISGFLDELEENGIDFIGGMTLMRLGSLMENMNIDNESILNGEETYNNMRFDNTVQASCNDWTTIYNAKNYEKMAEMGIIEDGETFCDYAYGERPDGFGSAPIFNPLHPKVEKALVEYFEEISEKFGRKKAFKGVSVNIWHGTLVWFSSLSVGYDDYTLSLFEKETGIKIPVEKNDRDRFRKRYEYLTRRNRECWIKWRCEKIHELILKLRDALRKYNPELKLYLCAWNEPVKLKMFGEFNESMQYPAFLSEDEFLREGGFDMSLFEEDEGICISMEQNQHRDRGWSTAGVNLPMESRAFFHDLCYLDKSWIDNMKRQKNSGCFVFDSWVEGWGNIVNEKFNIHTPGIDKVLKKLNCENLIFHGTTNKLPKDGFWFESQRQISSCFPTDNNYLEPFAHAIAGFDALYMLRGGLYLDQSHVKQIRTYTEAYTILPAVKFETVENNLADVVVRKLNLNGKFYFYAVNTLPYDVGVSVSFRDSAKLYKNGKYEEKNTDKINFTLPPFEMVSYVSDCENNVTNYTYSISPSDIEKLSEKYNKQLEIFARAKENGCTVYGMEKMCEDICDAYERKAYSEVTHLLRSYVARKTKAIYEKRCEKEVDDE